MDPAPEACKSRETGTLVKRRPHICIFCGKVLQNYLSLEMHVNGHTRERPWECSYCDATFMSYNVLMVHRNNIHYGRKYKCNLCHRLFKISAHLYTHRKRAHSHAQREAFLTRNQGAASTKRTIGKLGLLKKGKFTKLQPCGEVRADPDPPPETTLTNNTEEEERRHLVEIESNPGTPVMTVNVLSKDAEVVSKLKLPVIKIQRLPDGVWKQKIVGSSSQNETERELLVTEQNEFLENEEQDAEPEEMDEISTGDQVYAELKVYPPLPLYQYQTADPPQSDSPLVPLPHQIPPLPPFSLAFPPFPFKLHNYTVSPESTGGNGEYFMTGGGNYLNNTQQLQNLHPQYCWDTSFFLHLNRYKPEDSSCNHNNNNNNNNPDTPITKCPSDKTPDGKNSIRSTRGSYQYVSKFCIKKKLGITNRKSNKRSLKKEGLKSKKKKTNSPRKDTNGFAVKSVVVASKTEKEELIQESETGVFTCKQCGKQFQIKWNLLTHLMTHTGEKPFGCYFCKMRFRQKAHMIKHIASIHRFQDNDKKSATALIGNCKGKAKVCEKDDFSCGFCGEAYSIKLGLIKHISQLHSEKLVESV